MIASLFQSFPLRPACGIRVRSHSWIAGNVGRIPNLVKSVFPIDRAIPVDQLAASYVVCVARWTISTADLNQTFTDLPSNEDCHFAFVCNVRRVSEQVIVKVPRPVWRRIHESETAG